MLHQDDMRTLLNQVMRKDCAYHLAEIYDRIEGCNQLDSEDWMPSSNQKTQPRWKETVRRALYAAKCKGQANHPLPSIYIRLKPFQ